MSRDLQDLLPGSLENWLETLPDYQQKTLAEMLRLNEPKNVAIAWLDETGPSNTAPYGAIRSGANRFYERLLGELQAIICGNAPDAKSWHAEHQAVQQTAKHGRTALVTALASAAGEHLGVSAVLIAPAVAITLSIIGRAGADGICTALQELIDSITVKPNTSDSPTS